MMLDDWWINFNNATDPGHHPHEVGTVPVVESTAHSRGRRTKRGMADDGSITLPGTFYQIPYPVVGDSGQPATFSRPENARGAHLRTQPYPAIFIGEFDIDRFPAMTVTVILPVHIHLLTPSFNQGTVPWFAPAPGMTLVQVPFLALDRHLFN